VATLEALLAGVTRDDSNPSEPEWNFPGNVFVENLGARADVAAGDDIDANHDVFADVDGDGNGMFYDDCQGTAIEGCSNFNP